MFMNRLHKKSFLLASFTTLGSFTAALLAELFLNVFQSPPSLLQDIVLLIDASHKISENKLEEEKQTAIRFIKYRQCSKLTHDRLAIIQFGDNTTIKNGIAKDESKQEECLTQEQINEVEKFIQDQDYSTGSCQLRELEKYKEERDLFKHERDRFRNERNHFQEKDRLCQAKLRELHTDKPPMITLDEMAGYRFENGKTKLSTSFKELLSNKIPDLQKISQHYHVDVVEVISHTDGQNILGQRSHLDKKLEHIMAGQAPVETLQYTSNADLGLMRAFSVVLFLKQQALPKTIKFRVYSTAQLILPESDLAMIENQESNERRRWIELRFTRLKE